MKDKTIQKLMVTFKEPLLVKYLKVDTSIDKQSRHVQTCILIILHDHTLKKGTCETPLALQASHCAATPPPAG